MEKKFEQRLADLQKRHADESNRQKLEVQKAQAERRKIATEKGFLENDLREGTEQVKILQRNAKEQQANNTGPRKEEVTTPRKNKALPFRDGFEDDEMQVVSPSKMPIRSKPNTPKARGEKRKRIEPSPAQSLPLSQTKPTEPLNEPEGSGTAHIEGRTEGANEEASGLVKLKPKPVSGDQRFRMSQRLLNHRLDFGEPKSFEALAAFKFPSTPELALSTMLLNKLSELSTKPNVPNFQAALCLMVISLWSQCIKEKYYAPLHLLVDLLTYLLVFNPPGTAPLLIDPIMDPLQETAFNIMIERRRGAPTPKEYAHISTKECLEILHALAYDLQDKDDLSRFWKMMRYDFTMLMIKPWQPLGEISTALSLLRTSVLEDTFAMIVREQAKNEEILIDFLMNLLIETPRPSDKMQEPYLPSSISQLRIEVLSLLESLCGSTHGATALATNPRGIGTIARLMSDQLNRLYDHKSGHELRAELVNRGTRLLFHLTQSFGKSINVQEKLRMVTGAPQKHLIVLTRLAFSEPLYLERGIEDDVVECAYQMLDNFVSPEEAEALMEVFGRRGSQG